MLMFRTECLYSERNVDVQNRMSEYSESKYRHSLSESEYLHFDINSEAEYVDVADVQNRMSMFRIETLKFRTECHTTC